MFYAGVSVAKSAVDAGFIKALAVTGDVRSSALPHVPTFKEAGVADFELDSWTVLLAPKDTPAHVVTLLKQEVAQALIDPQVRASLAAQGVEQSPTQDVRAFLQREHEKYRKVVRELGIKLDQ